MASRCWGGRVKFEVKGEAERRVQRDGALERVVRWENDRGDEYRRKYRNDYCGKDKGHVPDASSVGGVVIATHWPGRRTEGLYVDCRERPCVLRTKNTAKSATNATPTIPPTMGALRVKLAVTVAGEASTTFV